MAASTRFAAVLAATAAFAASSPVLAQSTPAASTPAVQAPPADPATRYAARFAAECAGCHGVNGRSEMPGVPVLAGQYSLYVVTQLFLFREGRRDDAGMVAIGRQMTDDDLRGFSDHIGRLPAVPPPAPAEAPDQELMRRGAMLAHQYKCNFCHGKELEGGRQVPRIGGQKEEYLRRTLHQFKAGTRPGYTRAMTEALSQVPAEDLDLLAFYAANIGSGR